MGDGRLGERRLPVAAHLRRVVGGELGACELAGEQSAESRVDVQAADAPVAVPGRDAHLAPGRLEPAVEETGEGELLDVDALMLLELRDAGF